MAKMMMIDGVTAIMHFNSGTPAYFLASELGYNAADCRYCENPLGWPHPTRPGAQSGEIAHVNRSKAHSGGEKTLDKDIVHQVCGMDWNPRSFLWESPSKDRR